VFPKHISYDTGKTINRGGEKTQTGWKKKKNWLKTGKMFLQVRVASVLCHALASSPG